MHRRTLTKTSVNVAHRKELSLYERGIVVGLAGAGDTAPKIATKLDLRKSTVFDIFSKAL
ncbi:hypothetical protein K432DRAFT_312881 [Lepidopterella palustris CBS 459.81]|uniref:Uncharacterized protein n=1 Tax=Lepidopterella palustris CBS 459.81 TaxID=1314670 RepID=A0A8E2J8N4_9PEZI|nr:hypothetical protein K432DRAFT_312881 [Lepidopterella palustris CBS 459.81]